MEHTLLENKHVYQVPNRLLTLQGRICNSMFLLISRLMCDVDLLSPYNKTFILFTFKSNSFSKQTKMFHKFCFYDFSKALSLSIIHQINENNET